MENAAGGEAEAFARLYACHYDVIRAYSARRVGADDAEEVTAEVFLITWRRWPDPQIAGLAWLYTTAQHVVANHLRSRRRRDHAMEHLTTLARSTPYESMDAVPDRIAAATALLQLNEADRNILLAVAWDALSTTDLAGVLGCSVAAAYVRLHRARQRLNAVIADVERHPQDRLKEFR